MERQKDDMYHVYYLMDRAATTWCHTASIHTVVNFLNKKKRKNDLTERTMDKYLNINNGVSK